MAKPSKPRRFDPATTETLRKAEKALGYRFRDGEHLLEALTHRSSLAEYGRSRSRQSAEERKVADSQAVVGQRWNERLEFLGDSVLGLVISTHLMDRAENMAEGDLSKIRAAIVNEASLAGIARRIGLGDWLRLGLGEQKSGGANKDSLLADALEAAIGAVYRDGGFAEAFRVVTALCQEELSQDPGHLLAPDYKTLLQELLQESHRRTPTYVVVREDGVDHRKEFVMEVRLDDRVLGHGNGVSKKKAAQMAAKAALTLLHEQSKRSPRKRAVTAGQSDSEPTNSSIASAPKAASQSLSTPGGGAP